MRIAGRGTARLFLAVTLLVVFTPTALGRLAVMSIDLGGEFIKIAIVKPGVPMEIVLNKESSRKTQNIVAFRDDERHFANEAYNTGVRFPTKAFWFLTHIIGRTYDDPLVQQFRKRFPYYSQVMVKDEERGSIQFQADDSGTLYSTEELLGMILEKAREYAQSFAEQAIKDAVITVPPYYNQAERRAVLTAAQLVGINVLQLMNDNTAVALNYGVFRRKIFNTTTQFYMFYDMGATSTVATIVGYQMLKTKEGTRVETNPQLTIRGVGYDRNLGGLEMTLRLRDHLAKVFNAKKKRAVKVEDNPRAMAKLLKEAERLKKVLSANADHTAQIEGLLDGEDFAAKVTRDEYLDLVKDLLDRVSKPVEDALKVSEITMPEITEIILMGGSSRVPKVQEKLLEYTGKTDLGKSVNTDEAAALGAVYQAAFLGKGFKVKTFHVRDANLFPINVEFEKQRTAEDAAADKKSIKRTLFGRMNPYPQKKVMTFNKHFKDFNFEVRYGDLDFLSEEERLAIPTALLSNISLVGVEASLEKHSSEAEYKGVKAHFRMDESGVLLLEKVESVFEKQQALEAEPEKKDESTWSKIGNAFGGLFGAKEGAAEKDGKAGTVEDAESEHVETNQTESDPNSPAQNETASEQSEQEDASSDELKQSAEKQTPDTPEEKTEPDSEEKKDDPTSKESEDKKKETKEEEKKEEEGKAKEGEKSEKKEEDGEKTKDDKTADKKEKSTNGTKEKTAEEKKPAVPKVVTLKETIKAEVTVKDFHEMSKEQVTQARKRLSELQKRDKEKADLEKAKNELEAFIFDTQDKLSQETYEQCSTEEERTSILKQMSDASDWFYEQADDAKKDVYIDKMKELRELMKNVNLRVYEKEERPKALEALKYHLNATTTFLATVLNMTDPEDPIFTPVELATLDKLINDTVAWRESSLAEQKKLKDHENPSLLVESIGAKIYALEREMKYLINKAKNYRPKAKVDKAANSTAKANATDSASAKKPKGGKTKDDDKKKETEEDDEDGVVEEENDDSTTTLSPDSQESAPETAEKTKDSAAKPKTKDSTPKSTEDTAKQPDVEDKKTSKKKRPRKKKQEEVKKDDEEILELGADDLPTDTKAKDSKHTEL